MRNLISILGSWCMVLSGLLPFSPQALAQEDPKAGVPKGTPLEPISPGELDRRMDGMGPVCIDRVSITGHWVGDILREVRGRSVVFSRVRFEDGITLRDLQVGARLEFDRCEFSRPPVDGGQENTLLQCSFSGPLLFRQCLVNSDLAVDRCTFGDSLQFEGCTFEGRWFLDRCPMISSIVVRNSLFHRGGGFSGVVQGEAEFIQCTIDGDLRFQKAALKGSLTLTQSLFRGRKDIIEGPGLRLTQTEVLGRIDARDVQFEPPVVGAVSFQDTQFGGLAGLPWESVKPLLPLGGGADTISALRQIEIGFRKQGLGREADAAFIEWKTRSAEASGFWRRMFHGFMSITSQWGKSPGRLLGWFLLITVSFWMFYFIRLGRDVVRIEGKYSRRVLLILLACFNFSIRVTILQADDTDRSVLASLMAPPSSGLILPAIEAPDPKEELARRLRVPLQLHRMIATVFVAMLSACLGAMAAS